MKKLFIIPALVIAIGGGYLLAQTDLISGSAENQDMITAAKAKEIALNLYPGTIVSFEFDNDDRSPHYDIEITSETEKVDIEVDAVSSNAVITEREAIRNNNDGQNQAAVENAKISQDEAVKIAKAKFSGELHELDIDEDDNRFVYDIELRSATEKADFEIDAQTGEVIKFETEKLTNNGGATGSQNNAGNSSNGSAANAPKTQSPQLIISLDQAKQIALSKAAGTVVKAELDEDDLVYEIEIRNGKMEYDFEIDAKTSAVLSYEEDLDDDND